MDSTLLRGCDKCSGLTNHPDEVFSPPLRRAHQLVTIPAAKATRLPHVVPLHQHYRGPKYKYKPMYKKEAPSGDFTPGDCCPCHVTADCNLSNYKAIYKQSQN